MGWWKPYNVSGTIHIEDRVNGLCDVIREVLQTENVGIIGHFTGAITIAAQSEVGSFISSGFELHEFYAHVKGNHPQWRDFAYRLEKALSFSNFFYGIAVHDQTINEKQEE